MELHRRYGCILQMGGSDQWGNIVNGIDLTRRVIDGEVYGLTSPLLTTSDGKKMGKSQSGAIWLNPDMLSPYEFWQFWRNTTDADVGRFLKLYTELPVDECDRLGALEGSEINEAKIRLANEVTGLLHGPEAAVAAEATSREVFEKGGVGDDLPTLTIKIEDFIWVGSDASFTSGMMQDEKAQFLASLNKSKSEYHISATSLFVKVGLAKSGKEAKRLVSENGARIDDVLILNAGEMINAERFNKPIKLSAGKKRHALVQLG
jgi:tyrosyl-tRNA synthetase